MPTYIRLTDYKSSDEKEQEFFNPENRYEAKQENFKKIPASPIAYWVGKNIFHIFATSIKLKEEAELRSGIMTGSDDLFLRQWYEVENTKSGFDHIEYEDIKKYSKKWFPLNKGGGVRKWQGNKEFVINLENEGYDIDNSGLNYRLRDGKYYFRTGITWSEIGTGAFSCRIADKGTLFGSTGPTIYFKNDEVPLEVIAILNSKISTYFFNLLNPTHHFNIGATEEMPIFYSNNLNKINQLTQQNIDISKQEWDSRETSWDFADNELIKHKSDSSIETAYTNYCNYWQDKHNTLHQNEEELNRLFIDIYELQDELAADVGLKDITILKNETKIVDDELAFQADEIMKQFISYGVGVMFGRYSLDSDGLLIANMGQEVPTDTTFEIDDDNVIPLLDGNWFGDDIVERFYGFVRTTFGDEHYQQNIRFIEESIGKDIRKYFLKDFYTDHVKRYKKRPIYWVFSSAKGSFNVLIYMHRYQADTASIILNDYLREFRTKLESHKSQLESVSISTGSSAGEKTKALKEIDTIGKTLRELDDYEHEVLYPLATEQVEIDLDDGVKVNYNKFGAALKKVTGLSGK